MEGAAARRGKAQDLAQDALGIGRGQQRPVGGGADPNGVDDAEVVPSLLEQVEEPVGKLGGDGAYDKKKVYDELDGRKIEPIIPPREDAAYWTDGDGNDLDHPRNRALAIIDDVGRPEWKRRSGYHRRSRAEVAMFRYKTIFGPKMYARRFGNQKTEVRIKCAIINKFNQIGMPVSVKAA